MKNKNITQRINELLGTNYKGLITKSQWKEISISQKLSEDFIREFQDNVDWISISMYQKLSESFIREFQDKVNWGNISWYQKLSENFIREFQYEVSWYGISSHQNLSENFIRDFQDNVNWFRISKYQKLSEDFIREFQDKIDWWFISAFQKLSESFIREFQDGVNWNCISKYQKLSESFICEFQYKVDWYRISVNQKLSNEFIEKFNDSLYLNEIKDSWHYKTTEEKKQAVIATGLYECHDTYFIAYKGICGDRYSKFNFQYKYEKGGIYESWCDCSGNENSFGLSVWDEPNAREYCSELVVRVKVNYEDVGRVVHNGGKIRCFKIKILE